MSIDDNKSRREVLKTTTGAGAAIALTAGAGVGTATADSRSANDDPDRRPVVFVHGAAGSATQFESQAMRFSSNGYPDEYLAAFEYDSLSYGGGAIAGGILGNLLGSDDTSTEEVMAALDEKVDAVLDETGADAVDAMGHSLGTQVMGEYLSDDERASKVAHYAALDGWEHDSPPGGVPTIGVWGLGNHGSDGWFGSDPAEVGGGENVYFEQSHVELATSEETFEAVYEFFNDERPETTRIVQESADEVTIAGRGQLFPSNGVPGGDPSLEIYEIDPETGRRTTEEPIAAPELDGEGYWGPVDVDGDAYHEFALTTEDSDLTHHHYRPPELRSNRFVHLLSSEPDGGIARLIDRSDDHASLVALRDKEWWGDQGSESDELVVDGTNLATEDLMPQDDGTIGAFVFDDGADGASDLGSQPFLFSLLPFMSAFDYHIPAADPADGTIEVTSTPRGGDGVRREFTVPNYQSSEHHISLYFPDHTQTRS